MEYGDLFRAFLDFARQRTTHPWTAFCEKSIESLEHIAFANTGALIHLILHSQREAFDQLLEDFVTAQEFWRDPVAQFCFEVDLLNRPYIYQNTQILQKRRRFRHIKVSVAPDGYTVEIPPAYVEKLHGNVTLQAETPAATRFKIRHRGAQLPFMPSKSLNDHYMYCQDASQRIRTLTPVWQGMVAAPELVADTKLPLGHAAGRDHL